jgi:Cu+-exporting ATPase
LYDFIPNQEKLNTTSFEEIIGKGIFAEIEGVKVKLGSSQFLKTMTENTHKKTKVHVEFDGVYKGSYVFNNQYREGLERLFEQLSKKYNLIVLSGDNDGERKILKKMLPSNTSLVFNQKPEQKLQYIENLQKEGKNVMMIGDGLNDAGALAQSNIGISISENVNVFSPACDGILDASQFNKIAFFMNYSKNAMKTIYMSFGLSLLYNAGGLSYAVSGNLSPIVAAIIMPLSTITIVSFVTIMTNVYTRKR